MLRLAIPSPTSISIFVQRRRVVFDLDSQLRSRCNRSFIFYPSWRKSPRFKAAKPWEKGGGEKERERGRDEGKKALESVGSEIPRTLPLHPTAILTVSICLIDTPTSALRPHGNRFEDNVRFIIKYHSMRSDGILFYSRDIARSPSVLNRVTKFTANSARAPLNNGIQIFH